MIYFIVYLYATLLWPFVAQVSLSAVGFAADEMSAFPTKIGTKIHKNKQINKHS